jgi:hypothetical protein
MYVVHFGQYVSAHLCSVIIIGFTVCILSEWNQDLGWYRIWLCDYFIIRTPQKLFWASWYLHYWWGCWRGLLEGWKSKFLELLILVPKHYNKNLRKSHKVRNRDLLRSKAKGHECLIKKALMHRRTWLGWFSRGINVRKNDTRNFHYIFVRISGPHYYRHLVHLRHTYCHCVLMLSARPRTLSLR